MKTNMRLLLAAAGLSEIFSGFSASSMKAEGTEDKKKWELNVDSIMIVGKYLENNKDFINTMKVCKKYEELVLMYHFNPISDISLFENIETQHFYNEEDVKNKKNGLFQYIYWFPQCIGDAFYKEKQANESHEGVKHELFKRFIPYVAKGSWLYKDLADEHGIISSDLWLLANEQVQILWKETDQKIEGKSLYVCWYPRSYEQYKKNPYKNTIYKNVEFNNWVGYSRYYSDAKKKISEEHLFVPYGVTRIVDSCFEEVSKFAPCVFFATTSLREIGRRAFARTNISSITIPEGVINIGGGCFIDCFFLSNIILPSTLKMIGFAAFDSTNISEIAVCKGCKYGGKVNNCRESNKELQDKDMIKIDAEPDKYALAHVLTKDELKRYNENKKQKSSPPVGLSELLVCVEEMQALKKSLYDLREQEKTSLGNLIGLEDMDFQEISIDNIYKNIDNFCDFLKSKPTDDERMQRYKEYLHDLEKDADIVIKYNMLEDLSNKISEVSKRIRRYDAQIAPFEEKAIRWIEEAMKTNGQDNKTLKEHEKSYTEYLKIWGPIQDDYNNYNNRLRYLKNRLKYLPYKNQWQMTVDFIMIAGKYFESNNDFINVMKVSKRYGELVLMYRFNPISDISLFENIETQHFYNKEDITSKKNGLSQYIYWCPMSRIKRVSVNESTKDNAIFKNFELGEEEAGEVCSGGKVIIPLKYGKIGDECFKNLKDVTDISFCEDPLSPANKLREIGDSAFSCTGIAEITIPNGVRNIGKNCFLFCPKLSKIILPSSLREIGDSAFSRTGITEITIPNGVRRIGKNCFRACKELSKIILPPSLREIGDFAFSLTKISEIKVVKECNYNYKILQNERYIPSEKGNNIRVSVVFPDEIYQEKKKTDKVNEIYSETPDDDMFADYEESGEDDENNRIIYSDEDEENLSSETTN